jgi:hypothetical protein
MPSYTIEEELRRLPDLQRRELDPYRPAFLALREEDLAGGILGIMRGIEQDPSPTAGALVAFVVTASRLILLGRESRRPLQLIEFSDPELLEITLTGGGLMMGRYHRRDPQRFTLRLARGATMYLTNTPEQYNEEVLRPVLDIVKRNRLRTADPGQK